MTDYIISDKFADEVIKLLEEHTCEGITLRISRVILSCPLAEHDAKIRKELLDKICKENCVGRSIACKTCVVESLRITINSGKESDEG